MSGDRAVTIPGHAVFMGEYTRLAEVWQRHWSYWRSFSDLQLNLPLVDREIQPT
jgi:hypothetical protein